ncbi:MAG: AAA family ATPase [Deltaproteobacteria bacterium]|nr:AAA family ATPase [Deltaproteobacteria bacterium]
MYLKRLEIVGFKSFTERTSVVLSPGISAVVGPNGCGKSNIIDAIRWVMGEQNPRLLRARNMEDLLFNGSQGRPPAAVAEVTLTLARELDPERGLAEVSVTRRLYRGGDSEYLINRVPGRLKDIVRFFIEAGMGTHAYAIIEQEKVGRLVDAHPEERRLLLDEAAGITRYKEQKKESERRIQSAQQNLVTLAAMMAETKKQLQTVSRAAAKAARWRALRDELRESELALSGRRFLELSSQQASLSAEAADKKNALASLEATLVTTELKIDAARLQESSKAQVLEEALSLWHRLEGACDQLKMELDHVRDDWESASVRRGKALEELATLDDDRAGRLKEKLELESQTTTLVAQGAEAQQSRDRLREQWRVLKHAADQAEARRDDVFDRLSAARDRSQRLSETVAGAESLAEHLKNRHRSLELERNQSELSLSEARERLASRERFKKTLEDDLADLVAGVGDLVEERNQRRHALETEVKRLGDAEKRTAAVSSRLDTLENLKDGGFGWYPEGVKALLKSPQAKGLISPVAEALKVPDGYEEAAEAFLGERLSWLLVTDRTQAVEALSLAKNAGLGRCGFVSEADLPGADLAKALLGTISVSATFPPEAEPDPGGAILTKDGDYLSRAFLAGGGKPSSNNGSNSAGLLKRLKELELVRNELFDAEDKVAEIQSEVAAKRSELTEAEETLATAENQRNSLMTDISEANGKLMAAVSEEKGLAIRRDSLAGEIARNDTEAAACQKKLATATEERQVLLAEAEALEYDYQEASRESDSLSDDLDQIRDEGQTAASLTDSISERLESVKRELSRVSEWLESLQQRRQNLQDVTVHSETAMADLERSRTELEARLEGLPAQTAEAEQKVALLREEQAAGRAEVSALEEETRTARKACEEAASIVSEIENNLTETRFGLAKLKADLLKDWRVVLAGPKDVDEPAFNQPDEPLDADQIEGGRLEPEEDHWAAQENGSEPQSAKEPENDIEAEVSGSGQSQKPQDGSEAVNDPADQSAQPALASSDDDLAEPASSAPEDAPAGDQSLEGGSENDNLPEPEIIAPLAPPERLDPFDLAERPLPPNVEANIGLIRERLAAMGEINHTALEEEAELTARLEFHQTQHDDLIGAIDDLKDGINRINLTCRQRFTDTFEQADAKFRDIFPILFEGGQGWLDLTDKNDPLESGVEIHVHPPGKKIMVMRSLSGGEKTLTSLCLIFALYLIKPSPFCLLDEADAPLDEANIDRFNRLLRNLSEASQIIMVTHNKRTMQISDTLYGVTMETPGVSRLVSVNLAEAEVLTDA